MRRPPTAVLLLAALLGTLLLQGVLTASPAAAHAGLVGATPAQGARLDTAPDEVRLRFTEDVSIGAGYLRVLAPGGGRVDTGSPEVSDTTVSVGLRSGLPDASYVVTYRVVSADSHPVSGAFSFVVGDGELLPASAAAGGGDDVDPVVGAALPVTRWVTYAGLVLGLGVPAFLLLLWPGGWGSPLLRRLSGAGLAAVAAGTVGALLLQGPYAAGEGIGSLLDPQLLSTTAGSTYGRTLLVRLVLTLVAALVLLPWWRARRGPGTGGAVAVTVAAVAVVLTVAGVGHPVAGRLAALEVLVTAVHVAAMTVWLGGLVVLFAVVLRRGTSATDLVSVLPRWSQVASVVVVALVLSGVVQSVRQVGSPTALVHTAYGWVLISKVAVVLVVLALAALSRDWVQQQLGAGPRSGRRRPRRPVVAQAFAAGPAAPDPAALPDPDDAAEPAEQPATLGALRRWVLVEGIGAVVVLALSAVLVGLPPAQAAVAQPVEVTLPLRSAGGTAGNGTVQVELEPARPGPNTGHVYLFDADGELTQPREIGVTLTERAQQIGPLPATLAPAGPGHYTFDPDLPTSGSWTLTVTVRLDEFTAVTASTDFLVR
ncbi:copper resistance CopC family protein [Modestobacter sp. NPDC049651]|uniref:copper resistance CopC/CopD family protein n=1 Tax=unclassified Modestobacter TaxID=2643866 RepID=UPI0033D7BFB5